MRHNPVCIRQYIFDNPARWEEDEYYAPPAAREGGAACP